MKQDLRLTVSLFIPIALVALTFAVSSEAESLRIEMVDAKNFVDEEKQMAHFAFQLLDMDAKKLGEIGRQEIEASLTPGIEAKNCLILNSKGDLFAYAKQPGGYVETEILDKLQEHIFTVTTKWETCQ